MACGGQTTGFMLHVSVRLLSENYAEIISPETAMSIGIGYKEHFQNIVPVIFRTDSRLRQTDLFRQSDDP